MFRVGMKVVCIATPWEGDPAWATWMSLVPNRPILQGVYTVRGICPGVEPGIYLCETLNPVAKFSDCRAEGGFLRECFRPVVDRKTDTGMAIIKKLLQPKPERVE